MHTPHPEWIPVLHLQRFSAVEDGMHVEATGRPSAPATPIMTFRADELLGMQVVLHGQEDVAFPLSELKRAIALAEAEVHPESFYD
ncbi:MAG: hypothetical protein EOP37_22320 [Rubrivivax sp.]|nr:MAG: hypothetical protein EOP37_22320 [Rubrivivax sp.]